MCSVPNRAEAVCSPVSSLCHRSGHKVATSKSTTSMPPMPWSCFTQSRSKGRQEIAFAMSTVALCTWTTVPLSSIRNQSLIESASILRVYVLLYSTVLISRAQLHTRRVALVALCQTASGLLGTSFSQGPNHSIVLPDSSLIIPKAVIAAAVVAGGDGLARSVVSTKFVRGVSGTHLGMLKHFWRNT